MVRYTKESRSDHWVVLADGADVGVKLGTEEEADILVTRYEVMRDHLHWETET